MSGDRPRIPREHDYEDKDKSTLAGHHSLGMDEGQMSPGNHTHRVDDPTSIPPFDGVDVSLPGLTPEEQLEKIWDIIIDFGGIVIGGGLIQPPGIDFWIPGQPPPEPIPLQYPAGYKSAWYAGMSSSKDYLNTVNDEFYSEATPGWLLNIDSIANEISFNAGPNNQYTAIFNNGKLDYDGGTDSAATSSRSATSMSLMNSASQEGWDHTYKFVYTAPVPAGPEWNYVIFNLALCFGPGLVYVEEERVGPGGAIPQRYYRSVIYDMNSLPPTEVWNNGWQLGGDFQKWVISQARYTGFSKFYQCGPAQYMIERTFQPDEIWNLSAAGPSLVSSNSPAMADVGGLGGNQVGNFRTLNLQLRESGGSYFIVDLTSNSVVAGPSTLSELGVPDLPTGFDGPWRLDYDSGRYNHHTTDTDTLVLSMSRGRRDEAVNLVSVSSSLEVKPLGPYWFGTKLNSGVSLDHYTVYASHVYGDGSWAVVAGLQPEYTNSWARAVVLRSDSQTGMMVPKRYTSANPFTGTEMRLNTFDKDEAYVRGPRRSIADAKADVALGLVDFNDPPLFPGTGWSASSAGNRALMFWPTTGAGQTFYATDLAAIEGAV